MDGIETLGFNLANAPHAHGEYLETVFLNHGDDLADAAGSDGVGLDDGKCALKLAHICL